MGGGSQAEEGIETIGLWHQAFAVFSSGCFYNPIK
jgi:hypothetical protein